jgi:chromosome partitioning protein
VAPAVYTHRADYRMALEQGQGVTEFQPWQAAALEMRALWSWLRAELLLARASVAA